MPTRQTSIQLTEATERQVTALQSQGFGSFTDIVRLAIDRMHREERLMYTVERFNEKLGNSTIGMIKGRPHLWDKLNEFPALRDAVTFAQIQNGNIRIIRGDFEIRGGHIATAAESLEFPEAPTDANSLEQFVSGWVYGPGWAAADTTQDIIYFPPEDGRDANQYRKTYGL